MSAARAYLSPARRRSNLRIETDAEARRILFEGRRAVGVEYMKHGRIQMVHASAEVVLSAGAINTPKLLLLSGVGAAEDLSRLGIASLLDSPAVGRHLQDHFDVGLIYRSRVPTLNNQLHPWWGKLLAGMKYVAARRGPLALSLNQAGGFIRSRPELTRPNLQIYFSPLSYLKAPPGTRPLMNPDPYAAFHMSVSACRPTSRGILYLKSSDPADAPEIHPNYLGTEHDVQEVIEGLRFLRRIAETPTMRRLITAEVPPSPAGSDNDSLLDYARNHGVTVFHPAGTCRMGPDSTTCVVDAKLRVHGIDALRIADASIFPILPSGNINAPAILIGEKASDLILSGGT